MEVLQTEVFDKWFHKLRDRQAKARINIRIRRLTLNNPGDVKSIGGGVHELRVNYGPGYRLYFVYESDETALLLFGGSKKTQTQDIQKSLKLAQKIMLENSDE